MFSAMRSVAAVLAAVLLGTSLSMTVARADRPDSGQGEPEPTATPTPTPTPVSTPTPPVVIAPTVNAGNTVVINNPAPTGNPNVVTPGSVPIVVRNQVATEHRLLTVDGTILGSCNGNCTFQVPPGTYYLESSDTDEYRSGKKKIVVTGPTLVDVAPGSKSQKTTGLVLGSIGAGLFLVGFFGTILTAASNSSNDFDCRFRAECDEKTSVAPYVVALVLGVAGTTTGFIMFGTSSTKMKTSNYAPAAIGVAPMKNGMGLTVAF